MNTIERVAELLGPLEKSESKRDLPGGHDPIELTVRENAKHSVPPEPRELVAQMEAKVLAVELKAKAANQSGMPSEVLKVSRAYLREHGFLTPDSARSANAESFRRIKRQILARVAKPKTGAPPNLLMVTSALPGEGKTFCSINLAISIALEMDLTVLLVDADVAKPSVPKALGINLERGLLDVLLDSKIDLADVLRKTDIGKLTILPAGTAHQHSTELLASDAMRALLKEMAERYHDRIIVFDSPPLLAASEASVLASQMGQIVMVVEAGKTPEAALKTALGRIDANNVTGVLLNKGEDPGLRYHYGEYG